MAKAKKMTLRQRLRLAASDKLDRMLNDTYAAAGRVLDEHDSDIGRLMLLQLASQPAHSKTLRHDLITLLANEAEADLEKLYNDQIDILPGNEGKDDA